jgi:hypothetical protein
LDAVEAQKAKHNGEYSFFFWRVDRTHAWLMQFLLYSEQARREEVG